MKVEITQEKYDEMVNKIAKELPLVGKLLEQVGGPDKWPPHLRKDLEQRLKITRREVIEFDDPDECGCFGLSHKQTCPKWVMPF